MSVIFRWVKETILMRLYLNRVLTEGVGGEGHDKIFSEGRTF